MTDKNKQIKWEATKRQAAFCQELMNRLSVSFKTATKREYWATADNYTQMQADIIRLRRELNDLRKMLNPWGNE